MVGGTVPANAGTVHIFKMITIKIRNNVIFLCICTSN